MWSKFVCYVSFVGDLYFPMLSAVFQSTKKFFLLVFFTEAKFAWNHSRNTKIDPLETFILYLLGQTNGQMYKGTMQNVGKFTSFADGRMHNIK
jgi:hypothetical protein